MNKLLLFLIILLTNYIANDVTMADAKAVKIMNDDKKGTKKYTHLTPDDSVHGMVNHPAFNGFGQFLLPWDNGANDLNTPLRNIGSLMPYHHHVDPNIAVAAMNHMIDEVADGKTIFYDFYTEREKKADTAKASTGLFFFRGNPGAPFAIVCPGGGFAYVGSLHEGFPHALELIKKGYNAFVLKYRVGSELKATEDLAAALSYILKNADMFQVSIANYSLWGSSAGARMVGNIALSGPAEFGGVDLHKPRIVVIAYTGHTIYSEDFPPTFILVSEDDGIVHVPTVDRRVERLRNAGIEVVYRKYKHAGHGFGLGIGTDAEGWIEYAIRFWQNHQR